MKKASDALRLSGPTSRFPSPAWIIVITLTATSANAAWDRGDLRQFLNRPAPRAYAELYFADEDAFRRDLLESLRETYELRNATHLDRTVARCMKVYKLYFELAYRDQKLTEEQRDSLRSLLEDRTLYRGLRALAGLTLYIQTGKTRQALETFYAFPERFSMFTEIRDDHYRLFTRMLLSDFLSERLTAEGSRRRVHEFIEGSLRFLVEAMLFQQVGEDVRKTWWNQTVPYLQGYRSKASIVGKVILEHSEEIAGEYVRALFESHRYEAIQALKRNLSGYEPIIESAARDYLQKQREDVRRVQEIAPGATKATDDL